MQQPKKLESDGLIRKEIYALVPPKVEFSPTGMSASLEPIFRRMYAWGHARAPRVRASQGRPVFGSKGHDG